ncbi:MAG: outer membrane protein assembly factor BamB [Nitrosomonadales bacterium]|nr:outer membrane protein assembly factor BamB [Nitrosomonadales bacterium]
MIFAGITGRFFSGQALRPGSGLTLLLALLVLSGCASTDESIPDWAGVKGDVEPAKLTEFAETAKFEVRWHTSVGNAAADLLQPAVTKDAIYSSSGNGNLMRLDRDTGRQVWRIQVGIDVSSGAVASGEGLVLVGGEKGDVLAYDEQAKLRWKSRVSSEVSSISRVVDGMVLVRSGDGRISGLDASDGKRVWVYERSTPALVVRSHAGIVIQRGVAYAGFAGGRLAAISVKDGEVLWEAMVSQPRGNTELERISDVTSDPVVDDQQVCAIAFQGRIACFDISQGSPLWNRDISGDKGMMVLRRYFYLTDTNGNVLALDKLSGSTAWKNGQFLSRSVTAPYVLENFVVVGDFEGYLHGLNREDGNLASRIKLDGGAITDAPIEMDGGLLVQTRGGELYSLSLH